MTRLLTLTLALALATPLWGQGQEPLTPQRAQDLMSEAYDRMTAGSKLLQVAAKLAGDAAAQRREQAVQRYEQACVAYATVLAGLEDLSVPEAARDELRQIAHYNTACARARQGRNDEALDAFAAALAAGFQEFHLIARDPDLDPIREEPRFAQLLARTKARLEEKAAAQARQTLGAEALFPYDFKVKTLDGQELTLASFRGKVLIVDYWGTWCGPCREEIPHFVALKREFGDRLAILGMTWEQGQAGAPVVAGIEAFAKETGINYPLTLLTERKELDKVPGLDGFPTTLFIDKTGRVRARELGYRELHVIKGLVQALDAEEAPPVEEEKKPKPVGPF